jgi:hypothetical protein
VQAGLAALSEACLFEPAVGHQVLPWETVSAEPPRDVAVTRVRTISRGVGKGTPERHPVWPVVRPVLAGERIFEHICTLAPAWGTSGTDETPEGTERARATEQGLSLSLNINALYVLHGSTTIAGRAAF